VPQGSWRAANRHQLPAQHNGCRAIGGKVTRWRSDFGTARTIPDNIPVFALQLRSSTDVVLAVDHRCAAQCC